MKKVIIMLLLLSSLVIVAPTMGAEVISGKTSKIFHIPNDCRYSVSLSAVNTVNASANADLYDSYEDAIAAGLRACLVCKPQPSEIIDPDPDPVDPNIINIIPSMEAVSFFPINGIVLQSEYCRRAFDPEDIGKRIIEPIITPSTIATADSTLSMCPECMYFNTITGVGNIPQEYIIPETTVDPIDPNIIIITAYKIDSAMPIVVSNQSDHYHLDPACEFAKSVPVHMVNLRTGLLAGSNAYWDYKNGILEWRITPYEAGDYVAVVDSSYEGNTDVGQTTLAAITVRAERIPDLDVFEQKWINRGNFNLLQYSPWLADKELWYRYLGRIVKTAGSVIVPGRKVEWIFADGRWIPIFKGQNTISSIDIDKTVTESMTATRQTTKKEMQIAAFEWKIVELQEVTTEVTKFEGYTGYRKTPPDGSLDYLKEPPFAAASAAAEGEETPEELAVRLANYYDSLEIPHPPEAVLPPRELTEIMADANSIKNFTAQPSEMRMEASAQIIDQYIAEKEKYEKYVAELKAWTAIKNEKESAYHDEQMLDSYREDGMRAARRYEREADAMYSARDTMADSIAQVYAATASSLSEQEKMFLLELRRKIIEDDIDLVQVRWQAIEEMMHTLDDPIATEEPSESPETP